MSFKAYDILSKLITGLLISFIAIKLYIPSFDLDKSGGIIFITGLGYIVGYFVDTFSSWLESFYHFTWGGKPSDRFMAGKGIWKVAVPSNLKEIKKHLKSSVGSKSIQDKELFSIALRNEKSERVGDFYNLYAFSRSLLTSFLILFFLLIPMFYSYWTFYAISLFIIIITWLRAKQRAYYFVKEVLISTYLKSQSKD